MNDVVVNWKKIRRMLPTIRRYALDRIPTLDELREIVDSADIRGKALTLVLVFSGIREGAIPRLRVSHYGKLRTPNLAYRIPSNSSKDTHDIEGLNPDWAHMCDHLLCSRPGGIEHEIPVERVQEFDVFIIRPGEGLLQPIKSPNSTK